MRADPDCHECNDTGDCSKCEGLQSLSTSCPKPEKREKPSQRGPTARLRARKRRQQVYSERRAKAIVRKRDGYQCRWPGCDCRELRPHNRLIEAAFGPMFGMAWSELEVVHLEDKGMGGDPNMTRSQPHLMLTLCAWQHRGPFGLHSGLARITPLTDQGTDGPCRCERKERGESGKWYEVGISSPPAPMEME